MKAWIQRLLGVTAVQEELKEMRLRKVENNEMLSDAKCLSRIPQSPISSGKTRKIVQVHEESQEDWQTYRKKLEERKAKVKGYGRPYLPEVNGFSKPVHGYLDYEL
jgi:hypothetical protein